MKGARRMDLTERKKQILKRVVEDLSLIHI